MPNNVDEMGGGSVSGRRNAVAQLMAELRQPLTAAANYVGTARAMIGSGEASKTEAAVRKLDKAGEQILRAGEILNQLRTRLRDDGADIVDELP